MRPSRARWPLLGIPSSLVSQLVRRCTLRAAERGGGRARDLFRAAEIHGAGNRRQRVTRYVNGLTRERVRDGIGRSSFVVLIDERCFLIDGYSEGLIGAIEILVKI